MTVKDIATSDLLDRINQNQEFNKEYGLAYLLGLYGLCKGFPDSSKHAFRGRI